MPAGLNLARMLGFLALMGVCGCMVPKSQLNVCQTQNRALTEKNAALQSEAENLRTNRDHLLRKLQQAEEELTLVRQENELVRRRLELKETASAPSEPTYIPGQAALSPQSRLRLDQLAKRFPALGLNSTSGQCQLASDRLFQPGQAQLQAEAEPWLASFTQVLQSSEGKDLRVWIVAHSAGESSGTRFGQGSSAESTRLASQQALALQEKLRQMGLEDSRVALASVPAQPLGTASAGQTSPGQTAQGQSALVEVFLLPPEIPIVGWPPKTTAVY